MASGLYMLFIRDAVKESIKDKDENIILDKNEQSLLLLTHLCNLLEAHNFKKIIPHLQSVFVQSNKKIKDDSDWTIEMLSVTDSIKKIKEFLDQIPTESYEFYAKDFPFDRDLTPMQKTLALAWYTEHAKAIDSVFDSAIQKFKID